MTECMPIGILRISSSSPAIAAASHASSTVGLDEPIMFVYISPDMSLLFCSTTPNWLLSKLTSSDLISWPSK
ncbi:hypothetical protein D3C85_1665770 [compost metagenome]